MELLRCQAGIVHYEVFLRNNFHYFKIFGMLPSKVAEA